MWQKCIPVPGNHRTSMKPTSYCSSAHRRGNTRRLYHRSFWRCHDSARRPPRWKWRWHSCWSQQSYTGNPRWKRTPKEKVLRLKYSSQWRNQESKAIPLEFAYPYSFLIEPGGPVLVNRRPVTSGTVLVGFVVDEVARGQISFPVLLFSPVSTIKSVLHAH